MPAMISCGQCHESLLVEAAGLVACPLCGAHLEVTEESLLVAETAVESAPDTAIIPADGGTPPPENPEPTETMPPPETWLQSEAIHGTTAAPLDGDTGAMTNTSPPDTPFPAWLTPQVAIGVVSYASAMTLVVLYLLFLRSPSTHQLESLPDLVPPIDASGQIGMSIVSPANDVAPGHVLHLGESQRFGNLMVTPVRVTRGPLEFRHFHANNPATRPPSEPVLKLWLKLENVSARQPFPPLDRYVVYRRIYRDGGSRTLTNSFVGMESERRRGASGKLFYHYPLPLESEWVVADQKLDEPLAPGATVETFLASEEQTELGQGTAVWRFQFRKGIHELSRRGVTTLVDVQFDPREIQDEAAANATAG